MTKYVIDKATGNLVEKRPVDEPLQLMEPSPELRKAMDLYEQFRRDVMEMFTAPYSRR